MIVCLRLMTLFCNSDASSVIFLQKNEESLHRHGWFGDIEELLRKVVLYLFAWTVYCPSLAKLNCVPLNRLYYFSVRVLCS